VTRRSSWPLERYLDATEGGQRHGAASSLETLATAFARPMIHAVAAGDVGDFRDADRGAVSGSILRRGGPGSTPL